MNELLTVRFPDLKENQVIIRRTTKLTLNISLSGTDANKTLVTNLGRDIIRKLVVKLQGNEIIVTVGKVQPRGVMLSFKA